MKTIFDYPIAYSPRLVSRAFVPPLGEKRIRAAIRIGELVAHQIGVRSYVLRSDVEKWIASKAATPSSTRTINLGADHEHD